MTTENGIMKEKIYKLCEQLGPEYPTKSSISDVLINLSHSQEEVEHTFDTSDNQPSGDEVSSPGLTNTHDLITVQMLSTEQPRSTSTGMDEAVLPISPSTAEDEVMISPPTDTSDKYLSIIVQPNDKPGNKVLSPIVTDTHDQIAVSVLPTEQSVSNNTSSRNDGSNNFLS